MGLPGLFDQRTEIEDKSEKAIEIATDFLV